MRARLTALVVLVFAVGLLVPGVASANGDWIIDDDDDVTLDDDYSGSILIVADGITFDCAGNQVTGGGIDQQGIRIYADNVTVRNCSISGFGRSGVFTAETVGLTLEGNTVFDNGADGFGLYVSDGITATGNEAHDNTYSGFKIRSTTNSVFADNESWSNGFAGFFVAGDEAVGPSSGNLLTGNTSHQNSVGISVEGSSGNVFEGNEIYDNGDGVFLGHSDGNTLISNDSVRNGSSGFGLFLSNENHLEGNVAEHNGFLGVVLTASSFNTLLGNQSVGNVEYGFALWAEWDELAEDWIKPHDNVLMGNRAVLNGSAGFVTTRAHDNIFDGNHAINNLNWTGFWFGESEGNTVVNNTARNNRSGFQFLDAHGHEVRGNSAVSSTERGFVLWGSSDNTLSGNSAVNNGDRDEGWGVGFELGDGSSGNVVTGNRGNNNVSCDAADWGTSNTWQDNDFKTWCTE